MEFNIKKEVIIMLSFFKRKPKADDFIAPPPEIPTEEPMEKSKFFDDIAEPPSFSVPPEVDEFSDYIKELDKDMAAEPKKNSKPKLFSKSKPAAVKEKKIPAKQVKITTKRAKVKKITSKSSKSTKKKPKAANKTPDEDFNLDNIDFDVPEIPTSENIELPDNLEDLEPYNSGANQPKMTARPWEVQDAKDEIKTAIENLKKQERQSIFSKLFTKKEKIGETPLEIIPSMPVDEVSVIQDDINRARESLAKFELETTKNIYVEIMRMYNTLSQEQKEKVYEDIKELYFERKGAERMKS